MNVDSRVINGQEVLRKTDANGNRRWWTNVPPTFTAKQAGSPAFAIPSDAIESYRQQGYHITGNAYQEITLANEAEFPARFEGLFTAGSRWLPPIEPDPAPPPSLTSDMAKLRAELPVLASRLQSMGLLLDSDSDSEGGTATATAERVRLVPLGKLARTYHVYNMVPIPEFEGMIARHAGGDFGAVGTVNDIGLTDDHIFCPYKCGQLVRNTVAVATGRGAVRSDYPFKREDKHMDMVCVLTLIGFGPNRSAAWLRDRDGGVGW